MTTATVNGYDVTGTNYSHRPASGQAALYMTGSGGIAATTAMWQANPKAVRIDQSPVINTVDTTADTYDVETGAITVAELPSVIADARANYNRGVRPGQRWPAVYCNQSTLTPVANALTSAKLTGTGIWLANYNFTAAQAAAVIQQSSGPFPFIGIQHADVGFYDEDVWSVDWLNKVSGVPVANPTSGTQNQWKWCEKCQGLFYALNASKSRCPAGGTHDGSKSWDYSLPWKSV